MIFPRDVSKLINNNKSVLKREKTRNFIILGSISIIVLYLLVDQLTFYVPQLEVLIKLIFFILVFIVLFYVFTIFIFKVDEKREEYTKQSSDSFGRFISVKEGATSDFTFSNTKMYLYEYKNNSMYAVVKFRFGNNNKILQANTRDLIKTLQNEALKKSLFLTTIITTEDFRTSREYRKYIDSINNIEDPKIKAANKAIMQELTTYVDLNNRTDCIYFVVKATGYFFKPQLEDFLKTIITLNNKSLTAFRYIEYLDFNQVIKFFSDFYKIEAIDVASLKLKEASSDLQVIYSSIMSLYSIETIDREVYLNKDRQIIDFTPEERRIN